MAQKESSNNTERYFTQIQDKILESTFDLTVFDLYAVTRKYIPFTAAGNLYIFFHEIFLSPKKNEAKFLIIGDPAPKIGKEKYGLKDAKKEAKIINKKLKKIKNVSTTLLIGKKANAERIISELKKGYDFVHYTGHARFIVENPISQMKMESCINLNDRDLTASEIYNTLKKIPEVKRPIMVFLNACETGEEKFKSDEEFEKEISGLAQAFVRNNVNYIGSIWTIPVKMSKVFAVNFYYEILRGNSIGISLQEVKKDVYNQFVWYTLGWVSFILYGNPNLTLEIKK